MHGEGTTLDPHAPDDTLTHAVLGDVYERRAYDTAQPEARDRADSRLTSGLRLAERRWSVLSEVTLTKTATTGGLNSGSPIGAYR